jgi:hypothetical protein
MSEKRTEISELGEFGLIDQLAKAHKSKTLPPSKELGMMPQYLTQAN